MSDNCFVCQQKLPSTISMIGPSAVWKYDCPRCGLVHISDDVALFGDSILKERHHLLSGVLRWRKENGITNYAVIKSDQLEELLRYPLIPERLTKKPDLLLLYLGRKTSEIGTLIKINPFTDYPITFSRSNVEFQKILDELITGDIYIDREDGDNFKLSQRGLRRYEELEQTGLNSKQCFVAMNFDPQFDLAYEKITEAINGLGFKAYRTKGLSIEDVNDLIIAGIKESAFVVADFTGQKEGVYFEAGFARGLGKRVIWTCRKDDESNLHFDTRQFNHILWHDEEDLRKKLEASIRANIL